MTVLKNARHEKFAQELAKGKSQLDAYEAAGYKPDRGAATRLSANVSVIDRVSELQGKAADVAVITAADIAKQLDEDRKFAKDVGAAAAMVSATMGKAKVLGLIIEKRDLTSSDGSMSPKEPTYKLVEAKPGAAE